MGTLWSTICWLEVGQGKAAGELLKNKLERTSLPSQETETRTGKAAQVRTNLFAHFSLFLAEKKYLPTTFLQLAGKYWTSEVVLNLGGVCPLTDYCLWLPYMYMYCSCLAYLSQSQSWLKKELRKDRQAGFAWSELLRSYNLSEHGGIPPWSEIGLTNQQYKVLPLFPTVHGRV